MCKKKKSETLVSHFTWILRNWKWDQSFCVYRLSLFQWTENLPHLQKDLSELCAHFQEWMQVSTVQSYTKGFKIVGFEGLLSPAPTATTDTGL